MAIACPLQAVEPAEPGDEAESSFTRQTTSLLMTSAAQIVSAIERDAVESLYSVQDGPPLLSSNFCEALLAMQPPQERSRLTLSCTWAASKPMPAAAAVPRSVVFRQEYFPLIEKVYQNLQPAEDPSPDLFVGYVATLNGDMGEDGRMQGEVTLLILHEETSLRVRVDLDPDSYATAASAHMEGGAVAVHGALHRGRRIDRLKEVAGFRRVER